MNRSPIQEGDCCYKVVIGQISNNQQSLELRCRAHPTDMLTLRRCRSFGAPTFCAETESGERVRFFLKRNKTLCTTYRCRSNKVKRSLDLFKLAA